MMSRRLAIFALSSVAVPGWAAEDCVMMDSSPAANAVIARRSSEFFVRFDRPIDHVHSTLDITARRQVGRTASSAAGIGA